MSTPEPVAAPAVYVAPPVDDPRRDEVLDRLSRIGIVGASQAAGFGTGVGLADTLEAALGVPHQIHDSSVALMHLGAVDLGSVQITATKLRSVKMVLAIDFLFWFAYGDKQPAQRHAELQQGMAMLESLGVPVFVGDLPDVHGASRRMISGAQIPEVSDLAQLNAEIHAWAEGNPDVYVVPLADWMHALKQELPVELGDKTIHVSTGHMLQWDLLHPTAHGQALLTLLVLQQLRAEWGGLRDDDVLLDPAAVADLVVPSRTPAPEGSLPRPPDG
ncbi:MAG: hypothetical protein K0V04_38920 [Deltaproteobacteria bacterium]|nr:hypothetical protein [Deltaproteobacteria bacterium]